MKEAARGEPLARQAMQITRTFLDETAAVQSERQQLAMTQTLRFFLDSYLSISAAAETSVEQVYPEVLAWKGGVSALQQAIRRMRSVLQGGEKPEVVKLYADLEQASRALANLSRAAPDPKKPDQRRQDLQKLNEEIERLERALASASGEFRKELEQRRRTAEDGRQALQKNAVLVDLLEYDHFTPPAQGQGKSSWERRLVAFVVRPHRPIDRIDLGPAKPIATAIDEWRQTFGMGAITQDHNPAAELRRLVWEPLVPYLKDARIVLISPDSASARFPWAALPGEAPGTYLIEKVAIAVVPVPQLLPELLSQPARASDEPSLLLVGDVNFDAVPGGADTVASTRSAPHSDRSGKPLQWPALPGTRAEVVAIKDLFQRRFRRAPVIELREDEATVEEVRKEAPRSQYLHFATHGFFAPPEVPSALAAASRSDHPQAGDLVTRQDVAGYHPGLLSGLVLAGANQPVQPGRDDGILTALDVADLDLGGVELATLSVCETGLGESAGGEGLLGLQRAFQVAGARTVVASLWKLRDDAARSLMADFYENLWKKKMSRVEALRQAQLTMLREGIKRGLVLLDEQSADKSRRLPPYYWAPFVLSGDWR